MHIRFSSKTLKNFLYKFQGMYVGYFFFQGLIGRSTKTTVKIRNILFATLSHTYQLLLYIVNAPM